MTGTVFAPSPQQQAVIDSQTPTLLVLGGAGTGKTVTAAAAAWAHLARQDASGRRGDRALFLTFSRTAVTQILDRSRGILKGAAGRVDILTFHGFAWRLITDYGRYAGYGPGIRLRSEAERKLLAADPGILAYSDLLPAALRIIGMPVIGDLLKRRWSLVVCDEFQDTDAEQWKLLEALAVPGNRLLLLGDPNQMIYDKLPGRTGTGAARLKAARTRPGAEQLKLKHGSYRDPSQLLPAMAEAVRKRRFGDPTIAEALADGRLRVLTEVSEDPPADTVCAEIRLVGEAGAKSVGVYLHGNAPTAALSAALTARGIEHVAVGLSESYGEALSAIATMLAYAEGAAEWEEVLLRMAVFLTSAVRSKKIPALAQTLAAGTAVGALAERLRDIRLALRDAADLTAAARVAAQSWPSLSRTGERAWKRASAEAMLLVPLCARLDNPVRAITQRVAAARVDSFTEIDAGDTAPVHVMNLHQTKGREADAVVIVFRNDDYHGTEGEPFPTLSRLLYVVLTRARNQVILLLPPDPHPLVSPFVSIAGSASLAAVPQGPDLLRRHLAAMG
jgi:DNA helicase II / ATP-dependent DNA helicase PcrA